MSNIPKYIAIFESQGERVVTINSWSEQVFSTIKDAREAINVFFDEWEGGGWEYKKGAKIYRLEEIKT